jgi:hypothetical protein
VSSIGWQEIDLTQLVKEQLAHDPTRKVGFTIKADSWPFVRYASQENTNTNWQPELVVIAR